MQQNELKGTHLSDLYFEHVAARGLIDVMPYRRFTDMLNQRDRSFFTLREGTVQAVEQPFAAQKGQHTVIVPRLSVICGLLVEEGKPPSSFSAAEYRVKKNPRPAFCSFGPYAILGYFHMRAEQEVLDMFELMQEDFIPFTNCNFYMLAQPNVQPRSVNLVVVNRSKIGTFYFMD